MAGIEVTIVNNNLGPLAALLPRLINTAIRKQLAVTEADIKTGIVRYDAIDTGNMLGSTRTEMTGTTSGQVSVSAESEQGYPYPRAVNYGTVKMAPRPFFSEAEIKAKAEFAGRMNREINGAF
jgi:hypothetical protein